VPTEQVSSVKEQEETQGILKVAVKEVVEPQEAPEETADEPEKQNSTQPAPVETPEEAIDESEKPNSTQPAPIETPKEIKTQSPDETEEPSTTIVVKEGDTLTAMALSVYGQADENIINLVKRHNPQLEDINLLKVGEKIVFPPLSPITPGPVFTVHIASFEPFQPALEMFKKLMNEGHEAYIMPVYDAEKGKFFRVTLGNFKSQQEAKEYADTIIQNNVSEYAKAMRLEMR
jgi:hypothetical protein